MIRVSEKAVERLKDGLVQRCYSVGLGYRVFSNQDESGSKTFSIRLDKAKPDDKVVNLHGIRIILSPSEVDGLEHSRLDYLEGPAGGFCLQGEALVKKRSLVKK